MVKKIITNNIKVGQFLSVNHQAMPLSWFVPGAVVFYGGWT
jgi:hypothetical protein